MLCSVISSQSRPMTKQQFAEIDPSFGSEPMVLQPEHPHPEGNPMGNDGAGDGNPTGNDGAGDGNPTGNDGTLSPVPASVSGWRKL